MARVARSLLGLLPAVLWMTGPLSAAPGDPCSVNAPAIRQITDGLASARGAKEQAALLLERARRYSDQAQYRLAIADFARAIELDAGRVETYLGRGEARYEIGDHVGAIQDFTTAIQLDDSGPRAYLGRANALRDDGRPEQALADYADAIRLAPDAAESRFQRAIANHRQGRFAAEAADWSTAIRLDPDLYWQYGIVYRHRHLYEELRSDHRTARLHPPDNAKAYFNRGEAFYYLRRHCAAVRDFDAALELRPGYPDARLGRGIALTALGAYDAAIADLSAVLEREPGRVEAWYYRGLAHRAAGMRDAARADLASALRLAPFNPVVQAAAADP